MISALKVITFSILMQTTDLSIASSFFTACENEAESPARKTNTTVTLMMNKHKMQ